MKKITLLAFLLFSTNLLAKPLVDVEWLQKHINNEDIVIVDMASDSLQYQRFHIPGAIFLPYETLNRQQKGVSLSIDDNQLLMILGRLGIQQHSHVIVYDDMGGLNASRLFWDLERIGHKKVSLLDGGLVAWVLAGARVDNRPVAAKSTQYKQNDQGQDNAVTLDELRTLKHASLLDVRSQEEYQGHPRHKRSGHIPGAKHWPWDASITLEKGFILKPTKTLERSLEKIGINDKSAPVITYCRSGHRASQSYFVLRSLGYKNVKVYDASMAEYQRINSLPLELGK